MKLLLIFSLSFLLVFSSEMENLRFVTYVPGNSNIIIGSPHGGSDDLENAPVRQNGCYDGNSCDWKYDCSSPRLRNKCKVVVKQDFYTRPIAEMIGENIEQLSGKRPHMIHMNVHRRFLDVNRPKEQGTGGHALPGEAWDEFHDTIKQVRSNMTEGIYLDVHGQRHSHGLLELGYRVRTPDLNTHNFAATDTSIKSLASRVKVDTTLGDLIWGEASFGALLQSKGIPCVPSPEYPTPGTLKYYRGGYNTEQYGSQDGSGVDAIQLELPAWLRNAENGTRVAEALAQTIVAYTALYY